MLQVYKAHISAHLGSACRFEPSCSQYAKGCLQEHGVGRALQLITIRFLKCHPFGSCGYDPVPKNESLRGGA